jgi:hypothetical protein
MGIFERFQSRHATALPLAGEPKGNWSHQSQKDRIEQIETAEQIERCDSFIAIFEDQLVKAERAVECQVGNTVRREGFADYILPSWLREVDSLRAKIGAYKQQRTSLQARLDGLSNPAPELAAERQQKQRRLARLAATRLEIDRAIGERLEALQNALNEREELTRSMLQEAEGIAFSGAEDWIDQRRFDDLREQLPQDLAEQSNGWLEWFLGRKTRIGQRYVVTAKFIAVQEDLAASNVFARGEQVALSADEARHLKSSVAAAPASDVNGA